MSRSTHEHRLVDRPRVAWCGAAGQGVLVESAGVLVLAQLAQVNIEVVGRADGVGVVGQYAADAKRVPDPCQDDRSLMVGSGKPRGVRCRFGWWRDCSSGVIAEIPLAVWESPQPALTATTGRDSRPRSFHLRRFPRPGSPAETTRVMRSGLLPSSRPLPFNAVRCACFKSSRRNPRSSRRAGSCLGSK
jgi:hypothetical protein